MTLVVVGDLLLDRDLNGTVDRICPDAPAPVVDGITATARPGGAGLAACLAAARGADVTLVAAVADDDAGLELRRLLADAGVTVVPLALDGPTCEKVRLRAAGHTLARIDHGSEPGDVGPLTTAARKEIKRASAILVSDYGRGVASAPSVRNALAGMARRVPVVWDPHPRGHHPVPAVRLATPNRNEAAQFSGVTGESVAAAAGQARALAQRWNAHGVAVTIGARGAVLVERDAPPLAVPATAATPGDPCGAGDCFAATAAGALAEGALPSEAVVAAVAAASDFVGRGGAAAFPSSFSGLFSRSEGVNGPQNAEDGRDPERVVAAVRARGGTVVATG